MDMSPQRIRAAEFNIVRKGLDPGQVRSFLDEVADELEHAQNQSAAMEARARAAVARLQEAGEERAAPQPSTDDGEPSVTADQADAISKTLLLAQRTADATIADARAEADRILGEARAEADATIDSTRELSSKLVADARDEARRSGEAERLEVAGEVDALIARREFLLSDVDHLERFLADQRARLRDAAADISAIVDRVPAGLGDVRPPVMSASDASGDERSDGRTDVTDVTDVEMTDAEMTDVEMTDAAEDPGEHPGRSPDVALPPDVAMHSDVESIVAEVPPAVGGADDDTPAVGAAVTGDAGSTAEDDADSGGLTFRFDDERHD
jgi:DivIVA domain-containing protein